MKGWGSKGEQKTLERGGEVVDGGELDVVVLRLVLNDIKLVLNI